MPERIPALAALFYSWLPARIFLPHYQMIANSISLQENQTLLDVGTGPGMLPIRIAERFPKSKIVGIDLSEKMIEIACKNKARCNAPANVEFKVMDAKTLEFGDNSLDMVVSTGALHHWKKPVLVLNEIRRCLKPGSEAWIYDGYGDAADADIEKSIKKLFCGFPPTRLMKRILGFHGFSQSQYDTIVKSMVRNTSFKTCLFEKCGIMMRLRLRK